MENIAARKAVNALIQEAEIGSAAKFILDKTGTSGASGAVLDVAKKMMGGLWVGGTVTIGQKSLVFRPNWLNRLLHKAEYTVKIPYEKISQVNVRFGFVTRIVDVITGNCKFSFRCYGADAFADVLRKEIGWTIA